MIDPEAELGLFLPTPLFAKHPTNFQPNFFTESRQEFTELEKKIVVLVVNQIGHMSLQGAVKEGANVKFSVPYTELTRVRYDQISSAADSLQSKRLIYRNDKTQKFDYITPFPRVRSEIIDGKKVIELTMFADVVPHFAQLGQRYTKYDIDIMLSLASVYAQRMFEIVSMYYNRGQYRFQYTVEQLHMLLNCPDSYTYNEIRKNALKVAQREMIEKAGLYFDWTPVKKSGKKIVALMFSVKSAATVAAESVEQDKQLIGQMSINEAVVTAWQRIGKYKLKSWQKNMITSDHSLLEIFLRVDSELVNGVRTNIKNPTAYLVRSLGIEGVKAPPKAKEKSAATVVTQRPDTRRGEQTLESVILKLFDPKN